MGSDRWLVAATLATIVLVVAWCAWIYGDLATWVSTIDVNRTLFADFGAHYHKQALRMWGEHPSPHRGFFYGPASAVWFAPFGLLDRGTAWWIWGLLQAIGTLGLVGTLATTLRRDAAPTALVLGTPVLVLAMVPTWHTWVWGQTGVFRVLCWVLAYRWIERRPILAAAAVVASVLTKPSAALVLPFLLFVGHRRFWPALAGLAAICWVLVPVAWLGPARTWGFCLETLEVVEGATWMHRDPSSQALHHVVDRLAGRKVLGCTLGVQVSRALGVFVALLVAWSGRSPRAADRWLALSVALGSAMFWVPSAWPHDFVALPLGLACVAWRFPRIGWLCALALVAISAPGLLAFPHFRAWSGAGLLATAQCGCVAALVVAATQQRSQS